jgi:hypothetical protein
MMLRTQESAVNVMHKLEADLQQFRKAFNERILSVFSFLTSDHTY